MDARKTTAVAGTGAAPTGSPKGIDDEPTTVVAVVPPAEIMLSSDEGLSQDDNASSRADIDEMEAVIASMTDPNAREMTVKVCSPKGEVADDSSPETRCGSTGELASPKRKFDKSMSFNPVITKDSPPQSPTCKIRESRSYNELAVPKSQSEVRTSRKSLVDITGPLLKLGRKFTFAESAEDKNEETDDIPFARRKTFLGDISDDFSGSAKNGAIPMRAITRAISHCGHSTVLSEGLGDKISSLSQIRLRVWLFLEDGSLAFQTFMMLLIGMAILSSIHSVIPTWTSFPSEHGICYEDITSRSDKIGAFPCGATVFNTGWSPPPDQTFTDCRELCSVTLQCRGFVWSPNDDDHFNSTGVCLYYQETRYIAQSGCGFIGRDAYVFLRASCEDQNAVPTTGSHPIPNTDGMTPVPSLPSCSEYPACDANGDCCPNAHGFMLACCDSSSGIDQSAQSGLWWRHFSQAASIFFTLEVLLRWWSFPSRASFFFQVSNLCDVLAITPFWIFVFADLEDWKYFHFIYVLETLFRMLKCCRLFENWEILRHALRNSAQALTVPVFFVMLIVICLACTIFMVETSTADTFNDTVDARRIKTLAQAITYCFVCLISIDVSPVYTFQPRHDYSKYLSMVVMMSGVIFMAMPIAVVGNCFSQSWFDRDRIVLIAKMRQRMTQKGFAMTDLNDIFNEVDKDQSGLIEFPEFKQMVEIFLNMTNPITVRNLFQTFDVDSTGAITYEGFIGQLFPDISEEEFYHLVEDRKATLDPEHAEGRASTFDDNADGRAPSTWAPYFAEGDGDRTKMDRETVVPQDPVVPRETIGTVLEDDSAEENASRWQAGKTVVAVDESLCYGMSARFHGVPHDGAKGDVSAPPSMRTFAFKDGDRKLSSKKQRVSGGRSADPSSQKFQANRGFAQRSAATGARTSCEAPSSQMLRVNQRMMRLEEKLDYMSKLVTNVLEAVTGAPPPAAASERRLPSEIIPSVHKRSISQMSNYIGATLNFGRRMSHGSAGASGSTVGPHTKKRRSSYANATCSFMRAAEQRHGESLGGNPSSPSFKRKLSAVDRLDGFHAGEARRLSVSGKTALPSHAEGGSESADMDSVLPRSDFSITSGYDSHMRRNVGSINDLMDVSLSTDMLQPSRARINPISTISVDLGRIREYR